MSNNWLGTTWVDVLSWLSIILNFLGENMGLKLPAIFELILISVV